MSESVFEELKRYVRFSSVDGEALRALAPYAQPHFVEITSEFYARLVNHPGAAAVFSGPDQVARLKRTLQVWLAELLAGPWDAAYAVKRARIGRVHLQIALPQRFMFGAMAFVREALMHIAHVHFAAEPAHCEQVVMAVSKILDLELAMMLESYAESRESLVRQIERARSEHMAALGTMAAGLAHEIRNPLNAAALQLQLVQRRLQKRGPLAEPDGVIEAAGLVSDELKRLASMVGDFLLFARPQPLRMVRADVCQVAASMRALLSEEATAAGVDLRVECPGPVQIVLDPERFSQVLLNLVKNAMEAVPRGGHVVVRVGWASGTGARIEVEDDGPGLPNVSAPIFEPFYTTKPQGTGLGLAIAHRIVSDHGGTINVASRPGKTVFSITLPGSEKPAQAELLTH